MKKVPTFSAWLIIFDNFAEIILAEITFVYLYLEPVRESVNESLVILISGGVFLDSCYYDGYLDYILTIHLLIPLGAGNSYRRYRY